MCFIAKMCVVVWLLIGKYRFSLSFQFGARGTLKKIVFKLFMISSIAELFKLLK